MKDYTAQKNDSASSENDSSSIWDSAFDTTLGGVSKSHLNTLGKNEKQLFKDLGRKKEESRRVDINRNSTGEAHNRWDHQGKDSQYKKIFFEKFRGQSQIFFGEVLTHDQIQARILQKKAAFDEKGAEDIRKKLFAANEYAVIETLNSPENELYRKKGDNTYCNIYAYDVVTAMGGYLPRVWWQPAIEKDILNGKRKAEDIDLTRYNTTFIKEMLANELNNWIRTHGKSFGWVQAGSMKSAQEAANSGHIVIILAANKTTNGHVSVIAPESEQHHSITDSDGTTIPLQSQAGRTNFKYGSNKSNPRWWEDKNHQDGAAWIYMGQPQSPILGPEQLGLSSKINQSLLAPGHKDVGLPQYANQSSKGASSEKSGSKALNSAMSNASGGGGSW